MASVLGALLLQTGAGLRVESPSRTSLVQINSKFVMGYDEVNEEYTDPVALQDESEMVKETVGFLAAEDAKAKAKPQDVKPFQPSAKASAPAPPQKDKTVVKPKSPEKPVAKPLAPKVSEPVPLPHNSYEPSSTAVAVEFSEAIENALDALS